MPSKSPLNVGQQVVVVFARRRGGLDDALGNVGQQPRIRCHGAAALLVMTARCQRLDGLAYLDAGCALRARERTHREAAGIDASAQRAAVGANRFGVHWTLSASRGAAPVEDGEQARTPQPASQGYARVARQTHGLIVAALFFGVRTDFHQGLPAFLVKKRNARSALTNLTCMDSSACIGE